MGEMIPRRPKFLSAICSLQAEGRRRGSWWLWQIDPVKNHGRVTNA